MGDREVRRAEARLRGEEWQDQDFGDDEEGVDTGSGGRGPTEARGLRESREDDRNGHADHDVGGDAVQHGFQRVLLDEVHLAAHGDAAEIEQQRAQPNEICGIGCSRAVHRCQQKKSHAERDGAQAEDQ